MFRTRHEIDVTTSELENLANSLFYIRDAISNIKDRTNLNEEDERFYFNLIKSYYDMVERDIDVLKEVEQLICDYNTYKEHEQLEYKTSEFGIMIFFDIYGKRFDFGRRSFANCKTDISKEKFAYNCIRKIEDELNIELSDVVTAQIKKIVVDCLNGIYAQKGECNASYY